MYTWDDKDAFRYWADDDTLARKLARHGPKIITLHAAQVFSQNYEDAVIAEIYRRVGPGTRTFVEIGVQDGLECNTRLLLAQGWRGLWVQGGADDVARIEARFSAEIAAGGLVVRQAFVTRENIQGVLEEAGFGGDIDFLSVDIDMNTSHAWRAIKARPRVACIEYNAAFPPTVDLEVPYRTDAVWNGSNWFGASLKTLETIGRSQGMALVGCEIMGSNAFFVRDDLTGDRFLQPYDAETHFEPARYPLLKTRGHNRQD